VRQRASFLSSLPCFRNTPFPRLFKFASYLKREEYSAGASILPMGHRNSELLIVQDGEVEVHRQGMRGAPPCRLLTLGHGTCLGSLDMDSSTSRILLPSLRAASSGSSVAILRICRAEFEYRAGRRIVGEMGAQEADAWLMRIHAPGPLRTLLSGSQQITFKAMSAYGASTSPTHSSAAISPKPPSSRLASHCSRIDSSKGFGSGADKNDSTADLSDWLESERARLLSIAADKSLDHRQRRKRRSRAHAPRL